MHICCALKKHDYSNFSLTILEYCEPEKCLIREKHYWDIFNPEYNIAQDPIAPFSGHKHSDESKQIMSDAKKGENSPMFGKNHTEESKTIMSEAKKGENNPMFGKNHTEETKKIISDAVTGENNPMYGKNHSDESKKIMSDIKMGQTLSDDTKKKISEAKKGQARPEGSGRPAQVIEVTDITNNQTTTYDSISAAAKALNLPSYRAISNYINNNKGEAGCVQKPYKGQYIFKKI